jgi:hypothetical protein
LFIGVCIPGITTNRAKLRRVVVPPQIPQQFGNGRLIKALAGCDKRKLIIADIVAQVCVYHRQTVNTRALVFNPNALVNDTLTQLQILLFRTITHGCATFSLPLAAYNRPIPNKIIGKVSH